MTRRRQVVLVVVVLACLVAAMLLLSRAPDPSSDAPRAFPAESSTSAQLTTRTELTSDAPPVRAAEHAEPDVLPPPSSRRVELAAVVRDARSHAPIAASLDICTETVRADANGALRASWATNECVERGELTANGYETRVIAPRGDGPERWKLGTLLMTPVQAVTLTVRRDDHSPVSGASISVLASGRESAMWSAWEAGRTDAEGKLALRVRPGEIVLANESATGTSARVIVRAGDAAIELVLRASDARWLGFRDARTGDPLAGFDIDVTSGKSVPPLRWNGVTGRDGVLPLALPARQVTLSTSAAAHFVRKDARLVTLLAIDLAAVKSSAPLVQWIEVDRESGRWIQLTDENGKPAENAFAETFRNVELPSKERSDVRVGTQVLEHGLLDMQPFLEGGSDPLHALVTVPGFEAFDSRRVQRMPSAGETLIVRLQPAPPGALRLVRADKVAGGDVPAADTTVWLFVEGVEAPVAILVSDASGLVRDVPAVARALQVCSAPNTSAAFGEVSPRDLQRTPPLALRIADPARIVVEFGPRSAPADELELESERGGTLAPRVRGTRAIFDGLAAGRYVIGTAEQLRASMWRREIDVRSTFPIELRAGETLELVADPSWARADAASSVISGTVLLEGPPAGVVVALTDSVDAEHFITSPRNIADIDAAGHFELTAGPDVRALAAGAFDASTGAFVPWVVFAPGEANVVARAAHLGVGVEGDNPDVAIFQLRLHPDGFRAIASLARGSGSRGAAADFGWIPLGKHQLGEVGKTLLEVAITRTGPIELVLRADGNITPKH